MSLKLVGDIILILRLAGEVDVYDPTPVIENELSLDFSVADNSGYLVLF